MWRRVTVLLLILFGCATAKTSDVRATHDARFKAMIAGDVAALSPLLADDLVYVHSAAELETKQQFLERLRSGAMRYRSIEPTETVVRTYGTVAVVNGRAKMKVTNNGADRDVDLRYTAVYRFGDDAWQLVSWQSTRVP